MRSKVGLCRRLLSIGAIILLVAPLAGWAEGWTWLSSGGQNQPTSSATAAVQKDDSQLTVVHEETTNDEPVLQVVNKKSKKSSSFWNNKLFHPTQWFATSKSSKK